MYIYIHLTFWLGQKQTIGIDGFDFAINRASRPVRLNTSIILAFRALEASTAFGGCK